MEQDALKGPWTIGDLLDLEFFVCTDEERIAAEGEGPLIKRDRQLYIQIVKALEEDQPEPEDQELLRGWLCARRKLARVKGDRLILPSRIWHELTRTAAVLVPLLGLCSGGGIAFGLLSYTGAAPVNIFVFLGLVVGVPFAFLLLQAAAFGFRLLQGGHLGSSALLGLLGRWLLQRALSVKSLVRTSLDGQERQRLSAIIGRVIARRSLYGPLFGLPPFLLLQGFGVGFSAGALVATLLKIVFTDVAFGWQSTLALSPEVVHRAVQWLALPWSWLVGEGLPTLQEVEGSRMVLKEGIYHLSTPNLSSWWPLLCLAIAVYGLLPRVILVLSGRALLHRRLAGTDPAGHAYDRLLRRMQIETVTTTASCVWQQPGKSGATAVPASSAVAESGEVASERTILVMIPDELYEAFPLPELQAGLGRQLPLGALHTVRFGEVDADQEVLLASLGASEPPARVIVIQEAWQPPIREILAFFRHLRTRLGAAVPVSVVLIGKPGASPLTRPAEQDMGVWRDRLSALGDPFLEGLAWTA